MQDTAVSSQNSELIQYQGQFGLFTITDHDRKEVIIYRAGLVVSAVSFAIATVLVLGLGHSPVVLAVVNGLYAIFCLGLGVSLKMIHIYMIPLHRTLQIFWGIGVLASLGLMLYYTSPLAVIVYSQPWTILGVGFVFAALTGIFFKEAFCFNRIETKALTLVVPGLLLGHWAQALSLPLETTLLSLWALLYLVFAARKCFQEIPADIGDKSVFEYLKRRAKTAES